MIPKEYIDAYKSIKAPDTLRDRVSASAGSAVKRRRILPRLIAAAASFAVIFAAVTVLRQKSTDTLAYVAYNGLPVEASTEIDLNETSSIKHFGLGSSDSGGIRLEVHITDTTTVTVSDGAVALADENGSPTAHLLTLPDDRDTYIVSWLADFYKATESEPFSLVLEDSHGSVTYKLTASSSALILTKNS